MRFNEFKVVLKEDAAKFYTIGDSHAVAVATAGGKDWTNLAIGGRSSTDSTMLANIAKVPKGATVLVSQGANDTANAMKAAEQTKKPPKDPKAIAANVANVVNKVQAQGATVIFMLFPNGPGRGAGLAKYYGGDYQEEVRNAIKAVIDVEIIDINGKPLTDGVHATMGVYKDVANQVKAKAGITLGPTGATPGAPATKDKQGQGASPTALVLDVPTSRRSPAVRDVQQALMALGYPLPKHGADGIRGPETKAAVSKFQSDNNLTVDGDPGPETVGKLNDILKSKPEVAKKITKSTAADVKAVDYTKGAADLDALASDDSVKEAKLSAEKFLGRDIDDKEWNYLIRATSSEASNNSEEQANVMGVILNRARSGKWGNSIISVLRAPNQFQAVTGTRFDPNPSANFTRGPTRGQLANIVQGATKTLPNVPKDIMNFTSNVDAAYGAGTNIGFKSKLAAAPNSYVVGQTVFGTV
jgi:hypothetical protein